MGCSPKNVQGERGGFKGAFIQTTVGTEAGDDLSDPHTFSILRGLKFAVECSPAGPAHHKDKGTSGPGGFHSHLSGACPMLAGIFLQKHLFYTEKVSSFSGKLHCFLSHSPFVLGLLDARRLGDVLRTSS